MNLSLIHGVIVAVIDISALWMGVWVYSADRKSKANRLFLVIAIILVLWNTFAYSCQYFTKGGDIALFFGRLAYVSAAIFLIPVYFFINLFPKEEKRNSLLDKIIIIAGIFLFLVSWNKYVLTGIEFSPIVQGYIPVPGPGMYIPHSIVSFLAIYILFLLFKKYRKSDQEDKLKIQYIFVGLSIYLISNVIFDVVYVFWKHSFAYHFIGEYSAIIFLGLIALGIIKKRLFGIKVVLTELLVGLFSILLLAETFFSKSPFELLWRGLIFGIFLIFGYLITKETLRLDRFSDTLKEKVKERTMELEKEKDIAEQRAREIEKRKADLEHFYKLTVGRELKMIELKKKIKELEDKKRKSDNHI